MKANVHIDNNVVKIFGNVIYPNGLYPDKAVRVVLYHRDTNKVFKQVITDKYGYYEFSFDYKPSVIGIYELRFYGTIYPDKLEPEGDWQLIDLTKYDSVYVYYGEDDPNTITEWERLPKVNDIYIQKNNNLIQSIKWVYTDVNNWIIDSTIRFFIQTPNGTIVTDNQDVIANAAYDIGGNIFLINEESPYNFLKLYHDDTELGYSTTISSAQITEKYVINLIHAEKKTILFTVEFVYMNSFFDNIPPDETNMSSLITLGIN